MPAGNMPPMLLQATTTDVEAFAYWPDDGTQYAGYPYQWTVTLVVNGQSTSSTYTRFPYYYTALDIQIGTWYSNAVAGVACIVRSISSSDDSNIVCVMEDVNQFNTYADSSTNGIGQVVEFADGFFFNLVNGVPILTPLVYDIITSQWATDLISRFAYTVDQPLPVYRVHPIVATVHLGNLTTRVIPQGQPTPITATAVVGRLYVRAFVPQLIPASINTKAMVGRPSVRIGVTV